MIGIYCSLSPFDLDWAIEENGLRSSQILWRAALADFRCPSMNSLPTHRYRRKLELLAAWSSNNFIQAIATLHHSNGEQFALAVSECCFLILWLAPACEARNKNRESSHQPSVIACWRDLKVYFCHISGTKPSINASYSRPAVAQPFIPSDSVTLLIFIFPRSWIRSSNQPAALVPRPRDEPIVPFC
jgi:hypothetical protein